MEWINNSFDAHRASSASLVFNKPDFQINRVLAGTEVPVSHSVTVTQTPSCSEEQFIIWADCSKKDRLEEQGSPGCYGVCTPQVTPVSPTLTGNPACGASAGDGWHTRLKDSLWGGGAGQDPEARSFLLQGPLVLCCLNKHSVILRVFYFIHTAPHKVSFIIIIPILWARKWGLRNRLASYTVSHC